MWGSDYSGYTLPEAYQISVLSADGKNLANQNPTPPNSAKEIFTDKGAVAESCRGFAQSDMPDKFSDGSTGACEEGYYQFTHIYECVFGGAGWNASIKSCKFTPKVQVLDN